MCESGHLESGSESSRLESESIRIRIHLIFLESESKSESNCFESESGFESDIYSMQLNGIMWMSIPNPGVNKFEAESKSTVFPVYFCTVVELWSPNKSWNPDSNPNPPYISRIRIRILLFEVRIRIHPKKALNPDSNPNPDSHITGWHYIARLTIPPMCWNHFRKEKNEYSAFILFPPPTCHKCSLQSQTF